MRRRLATMRQELSIASLCLAIFTFPVVWVAPARAEKTSTLCATLSGAADAASVLESCLNRAPVGSEILLPPGHYELRHPIRIVKAVTLRSAMVAADAPRCPIEKEGNCATLALSPTTRVPEANEMPIEIRASHVSLSHIRIVGAGNAEQIRAKCLSDADRPAGGGLRVSASDFTLTGSVIRNVTCYTAIEVTPGADRLIVRNSFIGYNGDHRPGTIWSDGLTVHDATGVQVTGNLFVDNTDVQLIFGGCRNCVVTGNRFRHSGSFAGSSFAEMMLQSWPNTSGDFSRSVFRNNDIDCGRLRRCGYGIMLGSNPWYVGRAFGGAVQANKVTRAMIGLNVDGLTGPMVVTDNDVTDSGGVFPSACGTKLWPNVNVAASSKSMARGLDAQGVGSDSTIGCLLNRAAS